MDHLPNPRRLAAILAADIAGFSRLMNEDELSTVDDWQSVRADIIKPKISTFSGRIVKHTGDGFLAEFSTVTEAVKCAIDMQRDFAEFNKDKPESRHMNFRMGINLGEITVDEDDIHGDGVNIAARLESIADVPGICVTSHVYDQVHKIVSCPFEDIGEHQVKNIADPVHVYRIKCGFPGHKNNVVATTAGEGAAHTSAPIEIPSIAVLPFDNMSADPDQDYFADGLTEDILTQLSKFGDLFVISRNSTFTYKGKAVKATDVARELNVQYVVEGSVRKSGNRVRVTVQLIDAVRDHHVWADKYDRDLEDVFAIQDEITAAITATLPGRVEADTRDRSRSTPTNNMKAYECVLMGKVLHHRSNFDDNMKALQMLERAIEIDPGYVHARAWRACVLMQARVYEWVNDPDAVFREVLDELKRANSLDESDTDVHRVLAAVSIARGDLVQSRLHQEKALNLNPNYDLVVVQQGELYTWMGQPEEGIKWIKKAMQLNPFYPKRFQSHLGRAYFVSQRYQEAIESFKRAETLDSTHLAFLASCSAYLGKRAEAAEYRQAVLSEKPDFSIESHMELQHYLLESDHDHHRDGLLKSGLPL